jgi:hypothetical protein
MANGRRGGRNPWDSDTGIRIVPYAPLSDGNLLGSDGRRRRCRSTGTSRMGGDDGSPALTLQHELSHAWDHLHDSAIDIGGHTYTETRHFPDGHTEDRVAPRPELNSVGTFAGDGRVTFPYRPTDEPPTVACSERLPLD